MSNVTGNLVNETLTPAAMTNIGTSLTAIIATLPGGGQLTVTDEQSPQMRSMDKDNRLMLMKTIELYPQIAASMPPLLQLPRAQADLQLADQCVTIQGQLMQVWERVEALRRISSHEGMGFNDTAFGFIEMGAKAGMPGFQAVYDELKKFYKSNGGGAATQTGS